MGHLSEVFVRLALSHLRLHLTPRRNGKTVLEVPARAGLLDRIGLFFGREVRQYLYPVEAEQATAGPRSGDGGAGQRHCS